MVKERASSDRDQRNVNFMLEMQTNTKLPTIGTLLASWVIKLAILPITLSLKERVRMMVRVTSHMSRLT